MCIRDRYDDGKRGYGAAGGGGRFWRPQCDRPVFYWKYSGEGCPGTVDETAPETHTEPDGDVPEHAAEPVSYTHLDVYKRQRQGCVANVARIELH